MKPKRTVLSVFFLFVLVAVSSAQSTGRFVLDRYRTLELGARMAEEELSEESIARTVRFLSDSLCLGRASGTTGAVESSFWLARQYEHIGLMPVGETFSKSFFRDGRVFHNVVGFCPSPVFSDDYIVVMAHFDHVGILSGRHYPGADSNASGVSVMLSLAKLLCGMVPYGPAFKSNVIFVALDGNQFSMAGAEAFYDSIEDMALFNPATGRAITPERVSMAVNLDIVGSTLEPVHSGRRDYLIMLSTDQNLQRTLRDANISGRTYMDLSFDYYGSKDFTDLFLNRIGDHTVFIRHGIRSSLFTSGITMNTNKVTDTADALDYPILTRRTKLIFRWLELLLIGE